MFVYTRGCVFIDSMWSKLLLCVKAEVKRGINREVREEICGCVFTRIAVGQKLVFQLCLVSGMILVKPCACGCLSDNGVGNQDSVYICGCIRQLCRGCVQL